MFDTEKPFHLLPPNVVRPVPVSDDLISDLGWLPAGVMLTAALERVDRDRLSGHERVSVLKARSRQVAHDQAELLADIESVSEAIGELINDPDPDDRTVYDATSTEISAALTLTRRSAEVHVDLAYLLCQRLPTVWEALSDGLIDLARARLLADQTSHLPQDLARQVCDIALERAGSQTTGQLRARIQRLIISIDPAAAQDRYEQRLLEARVVCEPTDTGTANLYGLDLPADEASRAMRRINRMARKRKAKGDKRPIDLIRAELFLILLNGGNGQINGSDADRAQVNLNAELTTVLGLDEQPGEIPGFGPVISDVVRKIVANQPEADWNFGITHHTQLLDVITTRRRPTAAQQRLVETLDRECVFPTCRIDSADCDIDHQIPWTETHHTTVGELEPLCRYHHQQKHDNWKLKRTRPGTYQWTSPLGHTYTTGPDPP